MSSENRAGGEAKPLFTDLFDRTTYTLIEARGSVERGSIRMAIGRLADYGRFIDSAPARRRSASRASSARPRGSARFAKRADHLAGRRICFRGQRRRRTRVIAYGNDAPV